MHLERLTQKVFPDVLQAYTAKDVMLYAVGVGAGADPTDRGELKYVYERDLAPIPTIASVLAYPGFWLQDPALEIDWLRLLHGEQSIEVHRPLKAEGSVKGQFRVIGVEDKGKDRGATIFFEKRIVDAQTELPICTVRSTYFLRSDGGCGSFGERLTPPSALGDALDKTVVLPTLPRQAILYRLNGDYNPIHIDPAAAAKAGFDRPILHGLCTMGFACRGLINAVCDGEPSRVRSMFVRFSQPVLPGETIQLEFSEAPGGVRFRARVLERNIVCLDRGEFSFA
ncbi:MAG: MaoC/PaaZ C-terminal domain-containing protein [Rhizomicrobium sp.]